MSDKCQICDFYHEWNEPCREAESYMAGDGFIAFRDGLYIKPLSDESWNKRMVEIDIEKRRNKILNRLDYMIMTISSPIDLSTIVKIKIRFSEKINGLTGQGLTRKEIIILNDIANNHKIESGFEDFWRIYEISHR